MKTSNKIIVGIIALIAAIGLLFYAIMPTLAIFTVALWKWFLLAILLYWVVRLVGFGTTLANRLSAIFPLALIFIIFENDIAKWAGLQPDFANRWIVMAGAFLAVIAVQIIFSKVKFKDAVKIRLDKHSQNTTFEEGETEKSFSFGESTCHIDASAQRKTNISNSFGELHIFYQNTDIGDTSSPLSLEIKNAFGETVVHIPSDWFVECRIKNAMGDVESRTNAEITTRQITIIGKNSFGDIKIVSE